MRERQRESVREEEEYEKNQALLSFNGLTRSVALQCAVSGKETKLTNELIHNVNQL